jgi:hypothetical protein
MPKKVLLSNIKKVFLKVPNSIFQSSMIFLIPKLQKVLNFFFTILTVIIIHTYRGVRMDITNIYMALDS